MSTPESENIPDINFSFAEQPESKEESLDVAQKVKQINLKILDNSREFLADYLGNDFVEAATSEDIYELTQMFEPGEVLVMGNYRNIQYRQRNSSLPLSSTRQRISDILALYPQEELQQLLNEYDQSEQDAGAEKWTSQKGQRYKNLLGDHLDGIYESISEKYDGVLKEKGIKYPNFALGTLTNLNREFAENEKIYSTVLSEVKSTQESLAKLENRGEITEKLTDEQITEHLELREGLLENILKQKDSTQRQRIDFRKLVQAITDIPSDAAHKEQEVIYSGLILSPKCSTEDFVRRIEDITNNLETYIPESFDENSHVSATDALYEAIYNGLSKKFRDKANDPFANTTVFEVGGTSAATAFEKLGAVTPTAADAGHSGYSISYQAGSKDKMIELSNYRAYAAPHSADLVCSSRLFDLGSGIGTIAEPNSGDDAEKLGEQEMTLVMCNVLKENGFMIHYDGPPPEELRTQLGVTRVHATLSGAGIYRYHTRTDVPDHINLGKKKFVFNADTNTWEKEVAAQ